MVDKPTTVQLFKTKVYDECGTIVDCYVQGNRRETVAEICCK